MYRQDYLTSIHNKIIFFHHAIKIKNWLLKFIFKKKGLLQPYRQSYKRYDAVVQESMQQWLQESLWKNLFVQDDK